MIYVGHHYEIYPNWFAPPGCFCVVTAGSWTIMKHCEWHSESAPAYRQKLYVLMIRVRNYHPLMFIKSKGQGNAQQ